MGRIVISENVSLDGVMQDPTGQEGSERGGWFARMSEADRAAFGALAAEEARTSAALLLGRRTDRWFADGWSTREGPWADRLNAMPKFVVSSGSDPAAWSNATIIRDDEVAAVRDRTDGDLVVYGSNRLATALLAADLVDELRLLVFPVVVGGGERLFDGAPMTGLALRESRRLGDGLALLTYGRASVN